MFALVNPQEITKNWKGEEIGIRIVDVSETTYSVPEPLYWLPCDEGINHGDWYVNGSDNSIQAFPYPPFPAPPTDLLDENIPQGPKVVAI